MSDDARAKAEGEPVRLGLIHLAILLGFAMFLTGCPPGERQQREDVDASFGKNPPGQPNGNCPTPVHAGLAIRTVIFGGGGKTSIDIDTTGSFDNGTHVPEWVDWRSQAEQSPVCYVRATTITLTVVFRIARQPSASETIELRGTTQVGGATLTWTGTASVAPGDPDVTVSAMVSSAALPNVIACYDLMTIDWTVNAGGSGAVSVGQTSHLVYVILAAPWTTPAYWTLLDISCRAAHGQSTADDLMASLVPRFATRSLLRKRDGLPLTYWRSWPYLNGAPRCQAWSTRLMLESTQGWGQCGAFAELLRDMMRVHGVTTATKIVINSISPNEMFLVKNWRYVAPPAASATAYSHYWMRVDTAPATPTPGVAYHALGMGVPGQSNQNPPPQFGNHFIVEYGGRYYDPSYGTGPFADQRAWEIASIDGVGLWRETTLPVAQGATPTVGFSGSTTNVLSFSVSPV